MKRAVRLREELAGIARRQFDAVGDQQLAIKKVLQENGTLVREFNEAVLGDELVQELQSEWAEPKRTSQLTLDLDGVHLEVPDRPILVGEGQYVPRGKATFDQAIKSDDARVSHHRGEIQKAQRDKAQEEFVRDKIRENGGDVTKAWEELRWGDAKCWRCGEGYRAHDPFQIGHIETAKSKGGTDVGPEHRSCNQKARASATGPKPEAP